VIHSRLLQICRYCVPDRVPKGSFFLALIVGTVLNLIKQGKILIGGGKLNLIRFSCPMQYYCVATYGAQVTASKECWRKQACWTCVNGKASFCACFDYSSYRRAI
jgi:hypothetical protein